MAERLPIASAAWTMAASCGIRCSVRASRRAARLTVRVADGLSTRRGRLTRRVFGEGTRCDCWTTKAERSAESRVAEFRCHDRRTGTCSPLRDAPLPGQAYELTSGEESPLLAIRYCLGLPLDATAPAAFGAIGHHARDQCAADSPRGGDGVGHHARLRRRAAHRLSGPPKAVRVGHPQAAAAVFARWPKSTNGSRPMATVLRARPRRRSTSNLQELKAQGIESLAICLLNAYVNPRHEELVGRIAAEFGFAGGQPFQPCCRR